MGGAGVPGLQPIEDQDLSGGLIKLAISGIFSLSLLIMQQNRTEAVAGAFSRCQGFCGMRLGLLLLGRRWCIAGVFQQKVSSGCPPPPEVEAARPLLRGEDRQCLGGGRQRPGLVPVTLWNEDALEGSRRPALGSSFLKGNSKSGWDWPLEGQVLVP